MQVKRKANKYYDLKTYKEIIKSGGSMKDKFLNWLDLHQQTLDLWMIILWILIGINHLLVEYYINVVLEVALVTVLILNYCSKYKKIQK